MNIKDYPVDQSVLRNTYRHILSYSSTTKSDDPTISTLLEKGMGLVSQVRNLDEAYARSLPQLESTALSQSSLLRPDTLESLFSLRDSHPEVLERLNHDLIPVWVQARQKLMCGPESPDSMSLCSLLQALKESHHAITQSDLAEYTLEIWEKKQTQLHELAQFTQETLVPLIQNISSQIEKIDESLSTQINTNFFDTVLQLMPSDTLLSPLGTRADQSIFSSVSPTTHTVTDPQPQSSIAPSQSGSVPDSTSQSSPVSPPENIKTIVFTTPKEDGGDSVDLSTATPEAVAIKASYESLQKFFQFLSDSVEFSQQVSQRLSLSQELEKLKQRYETAVAQYRAIEGDLNDLTRVQQLLANISTYMGQSTLLEFSLLSYYNAMCQVQNYPSAFYSVYQLFLGYLHSLCLIWQ